MDINGEYLIASPRDRVWAALHDVRLLGLSLPGAEQVEQASDGNFSLITTSAHGPLAGRFHTAVTVSEPVPAEAATLTLDIRQGADAVAQGTVRVALHDAANGHTLLTYAADLIVSGALLHVGARPLHTAAATLAGTFINNLAATLASAHPVFAEPAVDAAAIAEVVPEETMPEPTVPPEETATADATPIAEAKPKRTHKPKAVPLSAPAPEEPPPQAEEIPLVELAPLSEALAPTLMLAAQEEAALKAETAQEAAQAETLEIDAPMSEAEAHAAAEAHARAVEHQVRPTEAEALGSAGISLPPEPAAPNGVSPPALTPPQPHPGLRPMIWIPILVLILLLLIVLIR
ncbi:MAG: SRPBCC domain-containing protein [Azospirillaceae bacterium]|nr:SRPBCC domain-containing protein [Azospirillaceae bacterium]